MELMVVVLIIGILAVLALPTMGRAKDDQRAYHAAQQVSQMLREARARAIGTGGAQVALFSATTAAAPGGTFTWLSQLDATGQEVGVCRQSWAAAPVLAGAGLRVQAALDFGQGRDADIGLQTSFQTAAGAPFGAVCFAPSGRTFVAADGAQLANPTPMLQTSAFDVSRTTGTGLIRSVVFTPSGMTRIISRTP